MNKTLKTGFDSVSWILYTATSTSIVTYALTGLRLLAVVPGVAVPGLTIAVYYYLGKKHQENEKH